MWDRAAHELSSQLFSSLPRSDQRRKGTDYLRGLLGANGRRSIRNIANFLGGSATEQSLHHFICSSTWDWAPVRQALARHLVHQAMPMAWVAQPMVIQKSGEKSVGVDRGYVSEAGQVLNAQQAVGIWAATEEMSSPVNWRLYLPPSWLQDEARRRKASIPDALGSWSLCDWAIDASIETARNWGLPVRPVVIDARHMDVGAIVRRFRAAGIPFLARVSGSLQLTATDQGLSRRASEVRPAGSVMAAARNRARAVIWHDRTSAASCPGAGVGLASMARVRLSPRAEGAQGVGGDLGLLGIADGWRQWPGELWLTDRVGTPLHTLVRMSKLMAGTELDFRETADRLGIRDFAGRSYGGWHRHVTLVSAAHAVSTLETACRPQLVQAS